MASTIPLPTFDGRLSSSFSLFESRLRSWFRIADTPDEETKRDILILCLKEPAAVWFDRQDNAKKADWESCVALLKGKYGTRNRMLTERKASANRLELRRFRDEKNEEEMVENLLDDLEDMMIRAGIEDDGIKKEILLGCFRDYNTAQKLLSQAQTFDEAVIQALKWEHNVIQKSVKLQQSTFASSPSSVR
ncbi:hypothetical protein BT69DRAFT_602701 [Atractiella rhizophila]|nr:hypothetical protein BT69DRAFT_602701 [Atractiella rhizophila]